MSDTDKELADAIHSARNALNDALFAAVMAGLEVDALTHKEERRISGILHFAPCISVRIKRPL